jgi:hypothetical protein
LEQIFTNAHPPRSTQIGPPVTYYPDRRRPSYAWAVWSQSHVRLHGSITQTNQNILGPHRHLTDVREDRLYLPQTNGTGQVSKASQNDMLSSAHEVPLPSCTHNFRGPRSDKAINEFDIKQWANTAPGADASLAVHVALNATKNVLSARPAARKTAHVNGKHSTQNSKTISQMRRRQVGPQLMATTRKMSWMLVGVTMSQVRPAGVLHREQCHWCAPITPGPRALLPTVRQREYIPQARQLLRLYPGVVSVAYLSL